MIAHLCHHRHDICTHYLDKCTIIKETQKKNHLYKVRLCLNTTYFTETEKLLLKVL